MAIFLTWLGNIVAIGQRWQSNTEYDYSTKPDSTRNQALIHTVSNGVRYFNTDDIIRIDIDDENNVTVEQTFGSYTYRNEVSEISFKKASKYNVSPSKHFQLENDAVNRYLNEVQYDGFEGSVITEYAVESGYRMDWPREFLLTTLPANISSDQVLYYKIWKCWEDELLFDGKGCLSYIEFVLNHLQPGNAYVYELIEQDSGPFVIDTLQLDGRLRMISSDIGFNIRDLGGWPTRDGKIIKYGKIYRGSAFNRGITNKDLSLINNQLGIDVEIDLRSIEELHLDDEDPSNDLNYSLFGDTISYNHYPMPLHDYVYEDDVYVRVFRTVLTSIRQGRNVYIHCAGGADRTGTIVLMLEALLGLSDSDMAKDFEITSFAPFYFENNNLRLCNRCSKTFDYFSGKTGCKGSSNEVTEQYMLSLGVTSEEINEFRDLMLASPFLCK